LKDELWAWHDYKKDTYSMVYNHRALVEMCSPVEVVMTVDEFLEQVRPALILPELVQLLDEYGEDKCSVLSGKIKARTTLWKTPRQRQSLVDSKPGQPKKLEDAVGMSLDGELLIKKKLS
jgi:hypothetical protein